jgi:hypothetical protein
MIEKQSFSKRFAELASKADWVDKERIYRHMFNQPKAPREVNPSGSTDSAFRIYLRARVLCKGQINDLGKYCYDLMVKECEEATEANAFAASNDPNFPEDRFRFLCHKVCIDAFVKNLPLDKTVVLQLAKDFTTAAPNYTPRRWDAVPQSKYQNAIDFLLLINERDEAKNMIENARGMRGRLVKERFATAKLILKSKTPIAENLTAAQQFRTTFDTLRNPSYDDGGVGPLNDDISLLVMACMWQKFFEPGEENGLSTGTYDCNRAVDLLWE